MLKKTLRFILPKKIIKLLVEKRHRKELQRLFKEDSRRFFQYSNMAKVSNVSHDCARIIARYHVLEKGLSFLPGRPFFGLDNLGQLLFDMQQYKAKGFSVTNVHFQSALHGMNEYLQRHKSLMNICPQSSRKLLSEIYIFLNDVGYPDENISSCSGGTRTITREEYQENTRESFCKFSKSRSSCRSFSEEKVPVLLIKKAIQIAQKSPSVCNRQGTRIYIITDKKIIAKVLFIHGGTRGFSDQIDKLLIVAGSLTIFFSPNERNQVYTDAGIFAMSLLYGLHYYGLGACPLHWAKDIQTDRRAHQLLSIPESEQIAMLIGVGFLPESFRVPVSQRYPLDDICFVMGEDSSENSSENSLSCL